MTREAIVSPGMIVEGTAAASSLRTGLALHGQG